MTIINSTIFKTIQQSIFDISVVGEKLTEINKLKLESTNISGYVTALKGLNLQQSELVLSTKGLTSAQQQAILSQISLSKATGTLTTAQMKAALTTDARNEADAEALLLRTGLITSNATEANSENVVTAAKLRELVQTNALTQAEADLLASKAGITLANQKEASSFTRLGTSLKNIGNSFKAIAVGHPILTAITVAISAITAAVTIAEKKNEDFIESQEKLIEKVNENVQKYNDEIDTLTDLQFKLENAKGKKEDLAQIQKELNDAIGDTPGLLNAESNAYDIANQKIDDRIKRLETLRQLELDDKVTAQKEIFNNSLVDNAWGIDHKFDYFSKHKVKVSDLFDASFKDFGLANTDGTNTIDVDVQQSGSGESQSNLPTIKVENGDTVSAIESSNGTLHGDLIDIKTAIEQGIIVKVDSPLTALNPEMMNFVRNYVPPMTNAVVNTLPQIAERKNVQNVINVHYDNLLNVEGNVDKDFAKVLPKHLEEAYQYTTKKLYRELNILK